MKPVSERIKNLPSSMIIGMCNAVNEFKCPDLSCSDCPFCTEQGDCYCRLARLVLEQRHKLTDIL